MTLADEFAAIAKAAFIAGAKSEVKRRGKKAGKAAVVYTADATVKGAKKAKRKVSKYQREFGRQLKLLKAKHPRTDVKKLMAKAHRATKRVMKK